MSIRKLTEDVKEYLPEGAMAPRESKATGPTNVVDFLAGEGADAAILDHFTPREVRRQVGLGVRDRAAVLAEMGRAQPEQEKPEPVEEPTRRVSPRDETFEEFVARMEAQDAPPSDEEYETYMASRRAEEFEYGPYDDNEEEL